MPERLKYLWNVRCGPISLFKNNAPKFEASHRKDKQDFLEVGDDK